MSEYTLQTLLFIYYGRLNPKLEEFGFYSKNGGFLNFFHLPEIKLTDEELLILQKLINLITENQNLYTDLRQRIKLIKILLKNEIGSRDIHLDSDIYLPDEFYYPEENIQERILTGWIILFHIQGINIIEYIFLFSLISPVITQDNAYKCAQDAEIYLNIQDSLFTRQWNYLKSLKKFHYPEKKQIKLNADLIRKVTDTVNMNEANRTIELTRTMVGIVNLWIYYKNKTIDFGYFQKTISGIDLAKEINQGKFSYTITKQIMHENPKVEKVVHEKLESLENFPEVQKMPVLEGFFKIFEDAMSFLINMKI